MSEYIELDYKELEHYLLSSGKFKSYRIKLREDAFMGDSIELYRVYNNEATTFITESSDPEYLKKMMI